MGLVESLGNYGQFGQAVNISSTHRCSYFITNIIRAHYNDLILMTCNLSSLYAQVSFVSILYFSIGVNFRSAIYDSFFVLLASATDCSTGVMGRERKQA